MSTGTVEQRRSDSGIRWRIGVTCALFSLCVVSTVRIASGAFEAASVPVADISPQNGMVSGTLRMTGNRFLLYNGARLESMAQSMEVNFERGGSMVLCPRSQLQILAANSNTGMMLAFQSGGAQQLFPIRMGDEVLTPDWRVELTSDARKGDMGMVQIVTNRHGDLCLQGNSQPGAYFRVSQLLGDASFHVDGSQSERFSAGKMVKSSAACGCDANFAARPDAEAPADSAVAASTPPVATMARAEMPSSFAAPASAQNIAVADSAPVKQRKKHPQDVAGYVHSFVKMMFGR